MTNLLENEKAFERDIAAVINRYSKENQSNTPDFILAQYVTTMLGVLAVAIQQREKWYGCEHKPTAFKDQLPGCSDCAPCIQRPPSGCKCNCHDPVGLPIEHFCCGSPVTISQTPAEKFCLKNCRQYHGQLEILGNRCFCDCHEPSPTPPEPKEFRCSSCKAPMTVDGFCCGEIERVNKPEPRGEFGAEVEKKINEILKNTYEGLNALNRENDLRSLIRLALGKGE